MPILAANPAFIAYAISLLVLCANLLALWIYSGTVRGKTKTTPNQEDATSFARGSQVVDAATPEVARVLRAHANAMANIVPFAFLALVYVLLGGGPTVAKALFAVFTLARVAHSLAYLGGKQPWRSLSFAVGVLVLVVLMGTVVRHLVAA